MSIFWITTMSIGNVSCNVNHNKDKNVVYNMLNIVQSIFNTRKRSIKFTRDTSVSFYDGLNNITKFLYFKIFC